MSNEIATNESGKPDQSSAGAFEAVAIPGSKGVGSACEKPSELGAESLFPAGEDVGAPVVGAVPEVVDATKPWVFGSQVIRQGGTRNEPLFVFRDVCEVLGISKHRDAYAKLPEFYRRTRPLRVDGLEGDRMVVREMATVNEAGLWRMFLRSDKPAAEPLIRWVTCEVLPAIRKTGRYECKSGQRGRPRLALDVASMFAEPKRYMDAQNASGLAHSTFEKRVRELRDAGKLVKLPDGRWAKNGGAS